MTSINDASNTVGQADQVATVQHTPWYRRKKTRSIGHHILVYAIALPGAIAMILPFLWMLSTSLKLPNQIFIFPPVWIPDPVMWENYSQGWFGFVNFNLFLRNSLIITLGNMLGNVLSCSLAAYGFARLQARGKNIMFMLVLSTMMIPMWVTLIPQYVIFAKIGWVNTFLPLMIPAWFGYPFFIFLLRQFFMTIPRDLDDAARIDGASTWGIYWRILLPLSKPALAAVAVFAFIGNWNNFEGPLIYLQDQDKYTLALALQHFQAEQGVYLYHYMMAVAVITLVPVIVIFFLAQRYFIKGVVMSGMKG